MGKLTSHVLDTTNGCPAAGLNLSLFRISGDRREPIGAFKTNHDGRVDGPLLEGEALDRGVYELVFAVGDYFKAKGLDIADPAFLNEVPVRFGINDASGHYHVPLLVSPYGYSTYRGS